MRLSILSLISFCAVVSFSSCKRDLTDPGTEYAPQMYHSIPYEQLSQIRDTDFEYYNSNPYNANNMNMRQPVSPNRVVKRMFNSPDEKAKGLDLMVAYRIPKDSFSIAKRELKNPYPHNEENIVEGGHLYLRYCSHCHGKEGDGKGKVNDVLHGVPAFNSYVKDRSEGEIFHTITYGKGRMGAHASQVSPHDRWKIIHFVQELQKK